MGVIRVLLFIWLGFTLPGIGHCQDYAVRGVVSDRASGERIVGASVFDPGSSTGTVTNQYGFFKLVPQHADSVQLKVNMVGYQEKTVVLKKDKTDEVIAIQLDPVELGEVVVVSERILRQESANKTVINSPNLLELPSLKPDIDILNIIQNEAGVQTALEGSSSFSVRGGNTDQNLVLIDNIPVYNSGHFGGFVSIFDPYTINNVTFYKAGFPARYGGRASSVVDINLKEGNLNSYHGEFKIGPLMSKLAVEGPIVKTKSSFLFSARRSNPDVFLQGLYLLQKPEERFNFKFHDLTFKINTAVNGENHLYFSIYQGIDKIQDRMDRNYPSDEGTNNTFNYHRLNSWGNLLMNIRWNRILSNKSFLNNSLAVSSYHYKYSQNDRSLQGDILSSLNSYRYGVNVRDYVWKSDLEMLLNENVALELGSSMVFHDFTPVDTQQERIQHSGMGKYQSTARVDLKALEIFAYAQAEVSNRNKNIMFSPGIRFGLYTIGGFEKWSAEPRLNLRYRTDKEGNFELDYSRVMQPVHSLNSSGTSLTPDIWVPATRKLAPVVSDQLSFSFSKSINRILLNHGLFYKSYSNLIDINRNNGFATAKEDWEDAIVGNGTGVAYGAEVTLEKTLNSSNISLNYTYSRSLRKFSQINEGESYPFSFDRPHVMSATFTHRLNASSTISLFHTLQSGQPFSISNLSYQSINNSFYINAGSEIGSPNINLPVPDPVFFQEVLYSTGVNTHRMPVYHRLDVSFSNRKDWKNGIAREWNFSIYNVYNRMNAYFIYLNPSKNSFEKFTLMPIMPSFSFGLQF